MWKREEKAWLGVVEFVAAVAVAVIEAVVGVVVIGTAVTGVAIVVVIVAVVKHWSDGEKQDFE